MAVAQTESTIQPMGTQVIIAGVGLAQHALQRSPGSPFCGKVLKSEMPSNLHPLELRVPDRVTWKACSLPRRPAGWPGTTKCICMSRSGEIMPHTGSVHGATDMRICV